MAVQNQDGFRVQVQQELASTPYKATSLTPLTGGTANFIFKATLETPLPDGTAEVAVKHGQGYVASRPSFAIPTSRCEVEKDCLDHLSQLPHSISPAFAIGTPKILHFAPDTNTQVQEYLPDAISLKEYALEHYKAPTSPSFKPQCLQLGRCLGHWLRAFHDWTGEVSAPKEFKETLVRNREMQTLKNTINYKQVLGMADKSEILAPAKEVFQMISDASDAELQDNSKMLPVHGDFWTGNVLLPNIPIEDGVKTPLRVIDWEMAQLGMRPLDLGQMIAEMWQLKLYKDIDAGIWLIEGFANGYGEIDDEFAFRTIIHVGIHLICFGSQTPGWGTKERAEELVKIGRDVVVNAWNTDIDTFKGHPLECLFPE
ncbi:hypothetical protein N3K66_001054 [Trichothecium roseum]|uniref:Uncharacterized protein n=1 Tax=Trichothecium roseum TaxID=47278 RepID=A0ACC0VDN1_9HYPO|nr:hypothetical protein N3K66_001054 [Trichothecium roseum]